MTVTFTLTLDDHTAFVLYQVQHGPYGLRRHWWGRLPRWVGHSLRALGLLLLAVCIITQLVLLITGGGWNLTLIAGCVGLLAACYQLLFVRHSVEKSVKETVRRQYAKGDLDRQLGERWLELTTHELIVTTDFNTSAIGWSAVEKIVTTQEHAFFYHGEHGATILPKRAFPSETEFTTFVETARTYQEAARRSDSAVVQPEEPAAAEVYRQPGGVVEVAFKLTPEDGLEFFRQYSLRDTWRSGFPSRWQGLLVVLIMAVILVPLIWQMVVLGQRAGLGIILGGILLALSFLPVIMMLFPQNPLMLRLMKRHMSKQRYYTEATHRLRLTPDNLIHAVDAQVKATPWESIERILTSADHAFFRISRAEILILPKRAFSQETEFSDFVDTANKYHQSGEGNEWKERGK